MWVGTEFSFHFHPQIDLLGYQNWLFLFYIIGNYPSCSTQVIIPSNTFTEHSFENPCSVFFPFFKHFSCTTVMWLQCFIHSSWFVKKPRNTGLLEFHCNLFSFIQLNLLQWTSSEFVFYVRRLLIILYSSYNTPCSYFPTGLSLVFIVFWNLVA